MKHLGWTIGKSTRRRSRKALQRGFTLVEILVVITIIGLIMSLVGPRVLNYLSDSKVKAAKIQIQSFTSALELFYLDAGRYPSSSEGLSGTSERNDAWREPGRSIICASMCRRPAVSSNNTS